jgi:ribosomal protein L11 methyltransferase
MAFGIVRVQLPRFVSVYGKKVEREDFINSLWSLLQDASIQGLQGVHEGTVLSDDAFKNGLETESWTIDSAEAPRERDWVSGVSQSQVELYFENLEQCEAARSYLISEGFVVESDVQVLEGVEQDWDEDWKKNFKGIDLAHGWRIVPPWEATTGATREIIVNPGAGFGTGTHETTQLCLEALGEILANNQFWLSSKNVLDFGAGSGILAIGASKVGGHVHAVEIDELAVSNAKENAELNKTDVQVVRYLEDLPSQKYSLIFANILRPVLIEFADKLTLRLMANDSHLILSGLVEADVERVVEVYSKLLNCRPATILAKNEWRAIVFSK